MFTYINHCMYESMVGLSVSVKCITKICCCLLKMHDNVPLNGMIVLQKNIVLVIMSHTLRTALPLSCVHS